MREQPELNQAYVQGEDPLSRRALEGLGLSICGSLVGAAAAAVDLAVDEALARLGRHIAVDRARILVFSERQPQVLSSHEFVRAGAGPSFFQIAEDGELPATLMRVKEAETVQLQENGDLGDGGAFAYCLPCRIGSKVAGALCLEWRGRDCAWLQELTVPLQLIGDVMMGAIGRARGEQALRLTADRFRSFVDATQEAVFCFEVEDGGLSTNADLLEHQTERILDSRLVLCNEPFARARGGASPEQLYGKRVRELSLAPLDRLKQLYLAAAGQGYTTDGVELEQRHPNGTLRIVTLQSRGVIENGRLIRVWGIMRDVTDQRRMETERAALEAQVRQMQKMESIGLLAGGVAHDFNNLLTVIANSTMLARDLLARGGDLQPVDVTLRQITAAADRAADLTKRLLAFSRRQPLSRDSLDLNEVLRGTMGLLARLIPETIDVRVVPGYDLGPVNGDKAQIEQALVNLCLNARDAISGVGRIVIETENVELGGSFLRDNAWARPGRFVQISVRDTGCGIPTEILDRIYEPFFTTKDPGKGSGLGLSMVYGIVKQHDGLIHTESEMGMGATFRLYFPIAPRVAAEPDTRVPLRAQGGDETVLVAEDHDMVRDVVHTILSRAGYRVLVARDGGEARRVFDENQSTIDLALLDAVMPVMSGQNVLAHIAAHRPDLPVLIASGYTTESMPTGLPGGVGYGFIPKPYEATELLKRIREALDTRRKATGTISN